MDFKIMIESTGILEWILLGLFFTTFLVQCFYYLGIYLRLPLFTSQRKEKEQQRDFRGHLCQK